MKIEVSVGEVYPAVSCLLPGDSQYGPDSSASDAVLEISDELATRVRRARDEWRAVEQILIRLYEQEGGRTP